jgi:hypothetical protein
MAISKNPFTWIISAVILVVAEVVTDIERFNLFKKIDDAGTHNAPALS